MLIMVKKLQRNVLKEFLNIVGVVSLLLLCDEPLGRINLKSSWLSQENTKCESIIDDTFSVSRMP